MGLILGGVGGLWGTRMHFTTLGDGDWGCAQLVMK